MSILVCDYFIDVLICAIGHSNEHPLSATCLPSNLRQDQRLSKKRDIELVVDLMDLHICLIEGKCLFPHVKTLKGVNIKMEKSMLIEPDEQASHLGDSVPRCDAVKEFLDAIGSEI